MNSIPLPMPFIENMQLQLGNEAELFFQSLETKSPISVRVNPKKKFSHSFKEPVEWCKEGYYLEERPRFNYDPIFHAGCYYVQEAGSMFIGEVFKQVQKALGNDYSLRILDLCAAPGGKSTHILSLLNENDLLISNEIIPARNKVLQYNITKWGYPNVFVTRNEARDFQSLSGYFDVIVVDAPCSGEGLFRREPEARKEWSARAVNGCSIRQKDILKNIIPSLKENGYLIYSTCTYENSENDDIVAYCCNELGCETVSIETTPTNALRTKYGMQFYPHRTKSEGFYISLLKKNNSSGETSYYSNKKIKPLSIPKLIEPYLKDAEKFVSIENKNSTIAIPQKLINDYEIISSLNIFYGGIDLGEIKNDTWIPSAALPLSVYFKDTNSIELNETDVIKYLKGESINPVSSLKGWCSINYKGNYIGWIKMLESRANNYYPKGWRI